MNGLKRCLLIVLVFSLSGCGLLAPAGPGGTPAPVPTPTLAPDMDLEEYRVYSDLLNAEYAPHHKVLVISDPTNVNMLNPIADRLKGVAGELKGLEPSTSDSFLKRNDRAYPLIAGSLAVSVPVVLLNDGQLKEFFGTEGKGFDAFYEAYPGAQGLMTISRVGFNDAGDQALVYAGNMSYSLAGAGYLFLMEKHGERWEITARTMVWIS